MLIATGEPHSHTPGRAAAGGERSRRRAYASVGGGAARQRAPDGRWAQSHHGGGPSVDQQLHSTQQHTYLLVCTAAVRHALRLKDVVTPY
jgi:hypothetical protein